MTFLHAQNIDIFSAISAAKFPDFSNAPNEILVFLSEEERIFQDVFSSIDARLQDYEDTINNLKPHAQDIGPEYLRAKAAVDRLRLELQKARQILVSQEVLLANVRGIISNCKATDPDNDTHDPGPGCYQG